MKSEALEGLLVITCYIGASLRREQTVAELSRHIHSALLFCLEAYYTYSLEA